MSILKFLSKETPLCDLCEVGDDKVCLLMLNYLGDIQKSTTGTLGKRIMNYYGHNTHCLYREVLFSINNFIAKSDIKYNPAVVRFGAKDIQAAFLRYFENLVENQSETLEDVLIGHFALNYEKWEAEYNAAKDQGNNEP